MDGINNHEGAVLMYTLQTIKDVLLPDIDEAVKRLKQADDPDPANRDVRPLMAILAKMSQVVPRLRGQIRTRRVAVSAFGWKIVPYDRTDTERAAQAAQRLANVIRFAQNSHAFAPCFGALAMELTWQTNTPVGTTPTVVRRCHPTEVERLTTTDVAILADGDTLQRTPITPEQRDGWLIDIEHDALVAGGLLRSLIFHEILLHESTREWNWYNQKLKGISQAMLEEWAGDDDKATAAAQLRQLAENSYSITSTAVEYKHTQMTATGGYSSFESFRKALEADRSIALLGQANTTELPNNGGSRAALEILRLISADIHYDDMQRFEALINDQLLPADFRMNFDKAAVTVPWRFTLDLSEEQDREKNARTITELLGNGIPLLRSEVYGQTGFSVPQEGDDVITPPQPNSGGFAI